MIINSFHSFTEKYTFKLSISKQTENHEVSLVRQFLDLYSCVVISHRNQYRTQTLILEYIDIPERKNCQLVGAVIMSTLIRKIKETKVTNRRMPKGLPN